MKDLKRNALKFLASSALVAVTGAASADEVFIQDVIVQGSLCVGIDCVNGEAFGFDTIRLKENNVRIKFDDTSNSGSFPNVDWELQANESANGGNNWFALLNGSAGTRPFTVYNGAGNNAMVLSSAGRLGLGTSAPGVDIDVKTGNTPALRLQQDSSSGFTAQTWDVAGNETNFFVRDVTNASRIPFKIRPTAPTNSLYIDADGDIGMGTATPGLSVALDIERAGDAIIELTNTTSGVNWQFKNQSDRFRITTPPGGDGEVELELNDDGDLTLSGLLSIRDGVTAPAAVASPAPQAQIYVDSADGDLKVMFADGTVRVLASD